MTLQLELAVDVPRANVAAAIAARVLRDLECLHADPLPEDELNARCRADLVRGWSMLLDWLDQQVVVPAAWRAWPCCACLADPGEPCNIPNRDRRDKWITAEPEERHHLDRGLDGRWSGIAA